MTDILILHGPNLNLLGCREPEIYGTITLEDIDIGLHSLAVELNQSVDIFQSNHEGELIDRIQETLQDGTRFIIFNPGAYTHTSIALRDALLSVNKPFIEIHLTNIYCRETFRRHSYLSDIAIGVISGLGEEGYQLALRYAVNYLTTRLGDSNTYGPT